MKLIRKIGNRKNIRRNSTLPLRSITQVLSFLILYYFSQLNCLSKNLPQNTSVSNLIPHKNKHITIKFLAKKNDSLELGYNGMDYSSSSILLIRFELLKNGYLSLLLVDNQGKVSIIKKPEFRLSGTYNLKSNGVLQGINLSELKGKYYFLSFLTDEQYLLNKNQLDIIGHWVMGDAQKLNFLQKYYYDSFYVNVIN